MKNLCLSIFLAASVLTAVPAASAQHSTGPFSTAARFAHRCLPHPQSPDFTTRSLEQGEQASADAWCSATVIGISDGLSVAEVSSHHTFKTGYCIREGYTPERIKNIVLKYITDRPQIGDMDTAAATLEALRDYFPCNGKPI